jgi:hypothetical protein
MPKMRVQNWNGLYLKCSLMFQNIEMQFDVSKYRNAVWCFKISKCSLMFQNIEMQFGVWKDRNAVWCFKDRPPRDGTQYIFWHGEQSYRGLRPILNFASRVKLWPYGWSCPKGWTLLPGGELSLWFSILLNSIECSPLGVNHLPRAQI